MQHTGKKRTPAEKLISSKNWWSLIMKWKAFENGLTGKYLAILLNVMLKQAN